MKKILAIILALACVLGLCACGTSGNGGSGGDKNVEGKVKLSIGIPTNALVLDHDKNALTAWLEEKCNVELSFVEYSGGTDVSTQITTTVAARKELPDILFGVRLNESTIERYGKDGYFMDLSDYFADKEDKAKIFWDRMNSELTESQREHVMRTITTPESGAIYGVPCVETSTVDTVHTHAWINQKWLDKLELKAPTNNEELVEVLRAFKTKDPNGNGVADEIPLFGASSGYGSSVVEWLVNTFIYFNDDNPLNVDKNGKVYPVYTTDQYREALKFIRQLSDEGLLSPVMWTTNANEMKTIATPTSGDAVCGIYLGHLTLTAAHGSPVLYDYVPLKHWGTVVRNDITCNLDTYITEDCDNPEKAFELLMTMWSWDGSMRVRYGEYKVNWDDPDPGAKSDMGLDATYKLLSDPLAIQSTAKWSRIASTLNVYAEGETAQMSENTDKWLATRSAMHAESYRLSVEVEEQNNDPSEICPKLVYTEEEGERRSAAIKNVGDYRNKAKSDFVSGILNPNSDADWNAYLKQLDELGLKQIIDSAQIAYDRS